MDVLGPLGDIVATIRELKVNALDSLGPLAPMVTGGGQIIAAGVAFMLLVAGRGLWAPSVPNLPNFPVRLTGLAAGILVVVLYRFSRIGYPFDFTLWAVVLVFVGIVLALYYVFLRLTKTFRCQGDKSLYVRGFRLQPAAQQLLSGNLAGLPTQYQPRPGQPVPASDDEFFCKSGKVPNRVWTPASHALAYLQLIVCYGLMMVPLTVGLASGSIALTQVQQVVEDPRETRIDLNSDVLFDFGEDTLRDAAVPGLEQVTALLRERGVTSARIEGHTDAKGTPEHNIPLSVRRANAVRDWLVGRGGLTGARFDVQGFGAARPIEPNVRDDGSDNPGGRQKNRRVSIVIDK